MNQRPWAFALLALGLAACEPQSTTPTPPAAGTQAGAQAPAQAGAQAPTQPAAGQLLPGQLPPPANGKEVPFLMPPNGVSGEVVETMNSGGYTYFKTKVGAHTLWAATGETQLKVGDKVDIPDGVMMMEFTSKTLNRTFVQIFFVNGIRVNGVGELPQPSSAPGSAPSSAPASGSASAPGGIPQDGAVPPDHARVPVNKVDLTGITKLEGGMTIAEIYQNRATLNGKPVKLRGKVVKYSAGIMGRNWLHIQDGTGAAQDGTHDLTVTSAFPYKVGDTVLVDGNVTTDKDFGQGYFYPLIMEYPKVSVEQ